MKPFFVSIALAFATTALTAPIAAIAAETAVKPAPVSVQPKTAFAGCDKARQWMQQNGYTELTTPSGSINEHLDRNKNGRACGPTNSKRQA
ncbi:MULTISPECIES: hypothetical protein [unclassified Microcoleus]|uniref:hypothetical protein n=1 Tax=unclassified Microcoleus TaxID=2642155 RepID=UPI001D9066A6|nr:MULTISPECIES: hypothetical protein [unclassified Microcoleus]MCC3600092.1 hypothetical protein [Microcoleus sp. PH2017_26_ELK_O_A]MCC3625052.1 hypothetical protein [Microcoleus sp. PH2017_36_ELK_O_B]